MRPSMHFAASSPLVWPIQRTTPFSVCLRRTAAGPTLYAGAAHRLPVCTHALAARARPRGTHSARSKHRAHKSYSMRRQVGGPPPFVGKEKLAERIAKLPPMDFAKVVEVYYTVSPKIFLCKTEVKFVDKPNSFFILDKFVVE